MLRLLKFIWLIKFLVFIRWKRCGLLLSGCGCGVMVLILIDLNFIVFNVLMYFLFLLRLVVRLSGFLNVRFM